MNKAILKTLASAAVAFAAIAVNAADIAYSGGGTDKKILTDPDNWTGGALPGADDVAVIDRQICPAAPVVGANWSVKGVRFTNGSSAGVWLGCSNGATLTLGEGGLECTLYSIYVQLPVVLAADQTWEMHGTRLYFSSPASVSGAYGWTVKDFGSVTHETSLFYSGTITYDKTYAPVWYKAAGRWADSVVFTHSGVSGERPVINITSGTISLSTLFGSPSQTFHSGPTMLNFGNFGHSGKYATFSLESGESLRLEHTYAALSGGEMRLNGGTLWATAYFDIGLDKDTFGTSSVSPSNAARLLVSGGLLSPVYLGVGRWNAGYADGGSVKVVDQVGGTVGENSRAYGICIGGGASLSEIEPLAEYRMGGGTLNFPNNGPANDSYNRGLVLSCNEDTSNSTIPGVFTMTGGTANVGRLQFGTRRNGHWGSEANAKPNYEGFGLFDLAGGTFNLGSGGLQLPPKWNNGGAESNAAYKVRLRGGTFAPNATMANTLALDIVANGNSAATISVASGLVFTQDAPVRGSGVLRKAGDGTLVLKDATRFTGDLQIAAGKVIVEGAAPDGLDDGAIIWTADDATADLADGDDVAVWRDATSTYEAGACTSANYTLLPKAHLNAFNGHAGVRFFYDSASGNSAAMKFPGGHNALCGATDYTVVAVVRPSNTSTSAENQNLTNSGWLWTDAIIGNSVNNSAAFFSMHYTKSGATAGGYFGGSGELPRASVTSDMQADRVSVVVATRKGSEFEVNVDGVQSNRVYAASMGTKSCWNGDVTKPLYIAYNYLGANRGFKGDIAEIRIYRNRALSAAEKESLVMALLRKYDGDAAHVASVVGDRSLPAADEFADDMAPVAPAAGSVWDAEALAALSAPAGASSPSFVTNALNGESVARFSGAEALVIPAASSPVSSSTAFTASVVFRATEKGEDESVYAGGLGLVSTKQAADSSPDFVLSWRNEGTLGGGYGASAGDVPFFSFKPCRMDDGEGHVAVFAFDPANGVMRLMTDGRTVTRALPRNEIRGQYDVLVGALRPDAGYFKGDIAEVRLFGRALTVDEMMALSEVCAKKYSFGLLGRFAYGEAKLAARGLGAKSISVAEGATLVIPGSSGGLCLGAGESIAGGGMIVGRLTLGDGATIDVDWNATRPIAFGDVAASGTVTIRVNNAPSRLDVGVAHPLVSFSSLDEAPGTQWVLEGVQARETELKRSKSGNTFFLRKNGGLKILFM